MIFCVMIVNSAMVVKNLLLHPIINFMQKKPMVMRSIIKSPNQNLLQTRIIFLIAPSRANFLYLCVVSLSSFLRLYWKKFICSSQKQKSFLPFAPQPSSPLEYVH